MKNIIHLVLLAVILILAVFAAWFLFTELGFTKTDQHFSANLENEISPQVIQESESPTQKPIKIIFVGDMQFDRNIRTLAEKSDEGYDATLDSKLGEYLASADFVIGNLEGPITDNDSLSVGSEVGSTRNYIFTFPPEVIPFLQKYNFVVNLGNNHIHNFGESGFRETLSYLDESGIDWFGQLPYLSNSQKEEEVYLYSDNNLSIAVVNYNQFLGPGFRKALEDIEFWQTKADLVFVYPHWGLEYENMANQIIRSQASEMIAAGADLVIGSHPHVIQQVESIEGKQVYYSLGNFIFDQYFSPEVRRGLVVEVQIDPSTKEMKFVQREVEMSGGKTSLLE